MLDLHLNRKNGRPLRILCLGAHSDDIEIGCGGTILKIIREVENVEIFWLVLGSDERRAREAHASASLFLRGVKKRKIMIEKFRDGFYPFHGEEIKETFERIKRVYSPDVIFTHYRDDRHQDHRLVSDLTWNTFRDHLILEYEIPKYDGDLGVPNSFVPLDELVCRRKVQYILKSFDSQKEKHWFTKDTFWSLLRIRGVESCSLGKYAEAFYARKAVLQC